MPDRGYLVADRDRRDHDLPAARRNHDQARLGDGAVPRINAELVDNAGKTLTERRRILRSPTLAVDAANHLWRR